MGKGGDEVPRIDLNAYQAWLFDMDGVLTKTALVHAAAWKQTFDEFLVGESARTGKRYAPFDPEADYQKYVDGEPREDGVRNFLKARGIVLPEGTASDGPDVRSVDGVGNRKNELVLKVMRTEGVAVYEGVIELVNELRRLKVKVAVVSASQNTKAALATAGIEGLFDAIVDGNVVKERHLAGKPAPDSFLEAARTLTVDASHAVVLEDALAGVEAGRAGRFALVIGVDHHDDGGRHDYADQLLAHGASVVLSNLGALLEDDTKSTTE